MPTCPRCALVAVVLAFLAFTGCDTNNPGRDIDLISGTYSVAEITFVPDGAGGVQSADVTARLNASGTRLEIFGDDAEALLVTQFDGQGSRRTDLTVSAARGQATFEAITADDEDDLARLLLPARFTLEYVGDNPAVLEGTIRQTADLHAFDPDTYPEGTMPPGRLTVRLERRGQ